MRHRRGNYSLFFAMLLPLLLGFMALAIDIGRLRVARVQVQGAADAAALAALAELRAGGTRGDAADSAEDAANATRLQGVADGAGLFDVDLSYGEWDFTGLEWSSASGSINGVSVEIEQNRPLNFLFAPIFESGGFASRVYASGTERDFSGRSLHLRRRASLRPRDVIFVVDASQEAVPHLDNIHAALGDAITSMRDLRLPDDRVAIVEYAGDAIVAHPLSSLEDDFADIQDELTGYGPCSYDTASWYYYYRFWAPTELEEMRGDAGFFEFNPVASLVAEGYSPFYRFEDGSASDEFLAEIFDAAAIPMPVYLADPDFDQQCLLNWSSNYLFLNFFPRMKDPDTGDALFNTSRLMCHAGHVLADDPDRFDEYIAVPEVEDCSEDHQPLEDLDGIESFSGSADFDPGYEHCDMSYQEAGVNPGAGLAQAIEILNAAGPSRNEATIILITTSAPKKGPDVDDALDAQRIYEEATAAAIDELSNMKANVHVISITPSGSDEEDFLSDLPTGRGIFRSTESSLSLSDLLDEAARDIKIQMVQ
jgi:hypothetical protein